MQTVGHVLRQIINH